MVNPPESPLHVLAPSSPAEYARPLGELLIAIGIDPHDVTLALHEQELGDPRRVGEILLAAGAVAREEVARALRLQQPAAARAPVLHGRRLGDILATLGVIPADVATVTAYEQELGDDRRIGEILVGDGRATQEQVEQALA